MFQFSTRRLFASVALIAIGVWFLSRPPDVAYPVNRMLIIWMAGAPFVGAGVGILHRHKVLGALLGAIIGAVAIYFYVRENTYLE
jgi:hypothetical protein